MIYLIIFILAFVLGLILGMLVAMPTKASVKSLACEGLVPGSNQAQVIDPVDPLDKIEL